MKFRKEDFVNCVGSVTIVTDNRIIFQGQIKRFEDRYCKQEWPTVEVNAQLESNPEFIVLSLSCEPALIRDNATIQTIDPDLFREGDIVRINLDEISAIGPSNGCIDDAEVAEGE
ncbi:hypothetical protein [Pelosinus propionicus]|uniref:Uncharacterized protein n=1 Tax=Pelosinus propionicus DSM 13327 TaxID=1123291 RepID=A0A1I4IY98_9FIRM|nr:hypothetical protein [Pelosinus propionicus]SFL58746.1 hypothetical protein SAMN04490355_10101 [Pelosinus propionicus DSM 13327]